MIHDPDSTQPDNATMVNVFSAYAKALNKTYATDDEVPGVLVVDCVLVVLFMLVVGCVLFVPRLG